MTPNQDGTYIYLTVPEKYNCVYKNILVRLADLGINIIEDCTSTCRGKNRNVINCWNMFQAACAAHELGEIKRANLLINYIIGQLKFECSKFYPDEEEDEDPVKVILTGFNIPGAVDGDGDLELNISIVNLTIVNSDLIKVGTLRLYDADTNTMLGIFAEVQNNPTLGSLTIKIPAGTSKSFIVKAETTTSIVESNIITIARKAALKPATLTGFSLPGVSNGTGALNTKITSINLTITNPENIDEGSLKVYDNSNNTVLATINTIKNNPSMGEITISIAEGASKSYVVKATTLGKDIQSNVVTITRSKAAVVTNRYYGTNENITEATITSGTKFTNKSIARVNVPTKVFWIAIPVSEKLIIDNADMAGDYYYNPSAGYDNNRLTKTNTTIDGKSYTFYKFTYFINQDMNLKITIS